MTTIANLDAAINAAPLFSPNANALKFITCGSVDDGKSTLIGRLLVDTKAVLQDHLAGVQRQGETDLALLTDGLSAEREQGITIDVAYRYFSTETRKFIIGDAPGHEQYTRNMVTAASSADAAVVLVDATKLDWQDAQLSLLPQTRRHSLLLKLLRVPSVVFAINKLDAVEDATVAYQNIQGALAKFATEASINVKAWVPVSALKGWNVVDSHANWCGYTGPNLLQILETLPNTPAEADEAMSFPVQWVEKFHDSNVTHQGRRVFWGRVATGTLSVGQSVKVFPSGQAASVAQVLSATRQDKTNVTGQSAGLVLDREVDVSRGDWVVAADSGLEGQRQINATVAWMDDEPLVAGRLYWALHGHRWVKAKVQRVVHRLNINTLAEEEATELPANAVGHVTLVFQEPLMTMPFEQSRILGALILVDTASHKTSGAVLVN
ncbi:MAG: Sulfate adenylyltransferase subunit 1 [Pseudomonadota bacterium]|jgi:sulfate adenylyltransferase subunit 1